MKKVLVTGSSGYIGSCLVKKLEERSDFEVLKFDYKDKTNVDLKGKLEAADIVVHLAAEKNLRDGDTSKMYIDDVALTGEIALSNKRVIFTSSVAAFENKSLYATSKRACEELIKGANKESIILRLNNVCGINSLGNPPFDKSLFQALYDNYKDPFKPVELFARQDTKRNYLYVVDLTDELLKVVLRPDNIEEKDFLLLAVGNDNMTALEFIKNVAVYNNFTPLVRVSPKVIQEQKEPNYLSNSWFFTNNVSKYKLTNG